MNTRESWLTAGIDALRPIFTAAGYTIPDNVRVTCGFPSKSALAAKNRRIGECWGEDASAGKMFEIFISPMLAEPSRVLDVLAHELVHATVGLAAKHGRAFKQCAVSIGLEGKMTATHAGEKLAAALATIVGNLGAYPHQELKHMTTGQKKQGTRLLKAECVCCGYTVRLARKWLEMAGAPLCPLTGCDNHGQPMSTE